jgi:hypothetical protein
MVLQVEPENAEPARDLFGAPVTAANAKAYAVYVPALLGIDFRMLQP